MFVYKAGSLSSGLFCLLKKLIGHTGQGRFSPIGPLPKGEAPRKGVD